MKTTSNRGGAPEGNLNALKHGRYLRQWKQFFESEREQLHFVQEVRAKVDVMIDDTSAQPEPE